MSHIDLEMRPTEPIGALFAAGRQAPRTARALRNAVETVLTWRQRVRMRHRLLTLDDRMLKDIGISRADVHGEAAKPFWRV